jgi:hypothetical protein
MATYTTEQYTELCSAIALGATFVKYSDKEVHFRTLAEMNSLKAEMEQDLGLANAPKRKWKGIYRKGLRG